MRWEGQRVFEKVSSDFTSSIDESTQRKLVGNSAWQQNSLKTLKNMRSRYVFFKG